MPLAAIWHGDAALAQRFKQAIEDNCTCEIDDAGQVNGKCPAHYAILDQRFLDGLVFVFYLRDRLLWEELR